MKRILLLTMVYVSGLVLTDVKSKPDSEHLTSVDTSLERLKTDVGVDIHDTVLSKANKMAEKKFPNDKSMQKYYAERILSGWGYINKK